MIRDSAAVEASAPDGREAVTLVHRLLRLSTPTPTGYVDLTDDVARIVTEARLACGIVHVQTLHTTTGILINECEPLLLTDMDQRLQRWAPAAADYRHDDLSRRTVNVGPGERRNGHAHCRAMLFRTSESVHIVDRRLVLGRWQRVLFVELDGPQERVVSVMVQGG